MTKHDLSLAASTRESKPTPWMVAAASLMALSLGCNAHFGMGQVSPIR